MEPSRHRKIRVIRDNLARKAVDYRTKLRCWKELKILYGLKHGGDRKTIKQSIDRLNLSEDEISKEVGFSVATLERMEKNSPEMAKDSLRNRIVL